MTFEKLENQNKSASKSKEKLPSYDEVMLEDIEKTYQKIRWIQTDLESEGKALEDEVNGKEITVFMGNSRVGKSTIIKYLTGSELQSVYWYKNKILDPSQTSGVFTGSRLPKSANLVLYEEDTDIGHGTRPHTSTPRAFSIQEHLEIDSEIIWDIPGFGDTGGFDQDIYNSICIQKLLKNAKSVKFVLVSSVKEIEGPGAKQFYDLLSVVSRMFDGADSRDIAKSFSIVFTMGSPKKYDREYIIELLADNVKSLELDQFMESLVDHFIGHQEKIGFFHAVQNIGRYSSHGEGIKIDGHSEMLEAIHSTSASSESILKTLGSCTSSSTKFFLLKELARIREMGIFKHLKSYYDTDLMEHEESFDIQVHNANPEEWLQHKKVNIADLEKKLSSAQEALRLGATLSDIIKILFPEDEATQAIVSKVKAIVDLVPKVYDLNEIFKTQLQVVVKVIDNKIKRYHAKLDLIQTEILIDKHSKKQANLDIKYDEIRTKLLECQKKIAKNTTDRDALVFKLSQKQAQYVDLNQSYIQQMKNLDDKESEYKERRNDLKIAKENEVLAKKVLEDAQKEECKHNPFQEGAIGGAGLGALGGLIGGAIGGGIGFAAAIYTGGQAMPLVINFAQNGFNIGGMIGGVGGGGLAYVGAREKLKEAQEKVKNAQVALQQSENARNQSQKECEELKNNLGVLILELEAIRELCEICEQDLEQERAECQQLEQYLEKIEEERKLIDLSNLETLRQKDENSLILQKIKERAKDLKVTVAKPTEIDYSDEDTIVSNKNQVSDGLIDTRILVSLAALHEENGVAFLTLDGNNHDLVRQALQEDDGQLNTRVFAINVSGNGQPRNEEGGTHWVTYVEIKNEDGVISGFVLNSSEEKYYSEATEELNSIISDLYRTLDKEIVILPTTHLDLQRDGKPSCGIWVLEFLEVLRQTEDIEHKTALEVYQNITDHLRGMVDPCIYIEAKRKEYDVSLETLDKEDPIINQDRVSASAPTMVESSNVIEEGNEAGMDFVTINQEDFAHMGMHDAVEILSEHLVGSDFDIEESSLLGNM